MKFASVLAFSSAAMASTILERQLTTIVGVVNEIEKQTVALDTAVKGYSGDFSSLSSASDSLSSTVTKGVSTVKAASSITLTDSVQIQGQVSNLQSAVESVVNDLISKKDTIVSAGKGGTVYKQLEGQLSGAKELAAAISSKVPPEVQSLAQQLSAGINTALQKGVDAYKGSADSSSSGSSSSGSSGSAGASGASSGSASSGSSSSSSGSSGTSAGAAVYTSAVPKPATFTGAATQVAAGSFAGVVAICVAIFAL